MKEKLRQALLNLNDEEFRELEHSIAMARKCSDLINNNGKDIEWFASQLGLSLFAAKQYVTGSYPFMIRDLARIETLIEQMNIEKLKAKNAQ